MDQTKFTYMSKKVNPVGGVTDDGYGVIIVNLRPGVQITHSYRKNNRMEIIFIEDQSHYEITSEKELESIYRIHLSNTNFIQPARKWCDEHLNRV